MTFIFDSSTVQPIKDQKSRASISLYRRQNYKLNGLLDRAGFPSCVLKRDIHAHTSLPLVAFQSKTHITVSVNTSAKFSSKAHRLISTETGKIYSSHQVPKPYNVSLILLRQLVVEMDLRLHEVLSLFLLSWRPSGKLCVLAP